jgi:hypothetical protein
MGTMSTFPSAAAIRVADTLRPILFKLVFSDGMSVRDACNEILATRRIKIPWEVAENLVHQEQRRRTRADEAKHSAAIAEVAATLDRPKAPELELPPGRGHKARVEYVKGHVLVTCGCGKRVCRLPRGETHEIERSWFEHREGVSRAA